MNYKLILFDVDGTLINESGIVRFGMRKALMKVFSSEGSIDEYVMSGKTDPQIMKELMLTAGIGKEIVEERLELACKEYIHSVNEALSMFAIHACVGVNDLLDKLQAQDNLLLGLLTGNLEGVVPIKLNAAHIKPGTFRVGAYGSDDENRNRLSKIAISRASNLLQQEISPDSVLVIGDTPRDIECARYGKIKIMSVATGNYSFDGLAKYSPDFLVEDLSDTETILRIIQSYAT